MKRILVAAALIIVGLGCSVSDLHFSPEGWKPLSEGTTAQPFKIGRKSTQLMPYAVRLSKIRALAGNVPPELFAELERRRFEVGDFDYSKGVGQELSWSETRMTVWAMSLQPLCASAELKTKYPWPAGAEKFLAAAYGRTIRDEDRAVIDEVLKTPNSGRNQKFEILCTTVLSSMEFLAL
ncbi:MAG: hypothetical protein ABL958_05435 [Bdellovibrionia bacterium]